jgi:hypothetical protein
MPSKSQEARDEQKKYWEGQLKLRLTLLNEKGLPSEKVYKDPTVRKIKAQLRATARRMEVIEGRRKKAEEMVRAKAEKMKGPKKAGAKKKKAPSEESGPSKRQLKKKMKKEGKES